MDVTEVITYKNNLVVNAQLATVSLTLGERVAQNTIFSWPLLQTIKASTMTENKDLFSGILVEQFNMEMMVPQISKETHKTSEGITVS